MTNRWAILAFLFCARTVMAMQFQLIGALSPALEQAFSISTVEIGVAMGLYFAPGLIFAMPGGAIANRFGEARVSAFGLLLMAIGGALMASTGTWSVFLTGQLIAGVGGVIVNVLMTKMVADSFRDANLGLALSILIVSWPMGIALSLVILPLVASRAGVSAASLLIAALAAVFAVMVVAFYRGRGASGPTKLRWPNKRDRALALSSGFVWGAFNAGLGVVFGFGTALLADTGLSHETAARQTSLVLWALAVVAPLGGIVFDRVSRPERLIAAGLVVLAGLTLLAIATAGHWVVFAAIGVASGLVAGPIMSLPAKTLSDEGKAAGMGIFFTVYYAAFLVTPPVAGWVAETLGAVGGAFYVGAALQALALAALMVFLRACNVRP